VAAPAPAASAPAAPSQPQSVGGVKLPSLPGVLNGIGSTLNKAIQNVPQVSVPNSVNNTLNTVGVGTNTGTTGPSNQSGSRSQKTLLNYLLAP
jgi:hypothetical protein